MEVSCPNCASRFYLPETVKMGARLRCSVCKHVFRLDDAIVLGLKEQGKAQTVSTSVQKPEAQPNDDLVMPSPKNTLFKKVVCWGFLLVLLGCVASIGWWYVQSASSSLPVNDEQACKVAKLSMYDVRQYYVENEKIGKICVIEGKIINGFTVARDLIELEASIYSKSKEMLQSKRVFAGTSLPFLQLKTMTEKELDILLANKIEILNKNTNVNSGASVPFMVLFYTPKTDVAEFSVRIVDARESKPIQSEVLSKQVHDGERPHADLPAVSADTP